MSKPEALFNTETTVDPFSTLVVALELSDKTWKICAVVPGVSIRSLIAPLPSSGRRRPRQ
jgi:hypothetical protein